MGSAPSDGSRRSGLCSGPPKFPVLRTAQLRVALTVFVEGKWVKSAGLLSAGEYPSMGGRRGVLVRLTVDSRRDAFPQESAHGVGESVVLISCDHVRRARNFHERYVGKRSHEIVDALLGNDVGQ